MDYEGTRIILIYKYLGLTQGQFAEKLGFSRHMIQKYTKGAEPSVRFIQAIEANFPEININYIRNKEDNMLREDAPKEISSGCSHCDEKDRLITHLEERLNDKDVVIDALRDQLNMYRHQLDDCVDKSKRA